MPVGAGFIPARIGENKKMTEHKKLQPEIRFAGFTDDWEQRKLGDLAHTFIGGGTPATNNIEFWDGSIPWLQSSDLIEDIVFNIIPRKFISKKALKKSATKLIPSNSITIVTRVGVGKLALIPYEFATSQDFISFSELKLDLIFASYAFYRLMKEESKSTQGTSIKGITKEVILNKYIYVPKSKEEQTQIGNFFKQLDDTIALHQRTLEKYQKLKVSYLEKMFPKGNERYPELRFPNSTDAWEQRKLGEVVEFFSGLTYSPTDVLNNGTLVLRSSNIQDSQIVTDDNVYVRPECVYSQNVEIGDIVVVVRNGSKNLIGKHALVSKQMNNTVIGAFMTGIRSNNPSFFNALLDTSKFNDEIEKNLGATINQITTGAFKSMEFLIPSYEEQTQIGNFFKQLDDTIALHQREVEKYKKIKQSYLEKMFI